MAIPCRKAGTEPGLQAIWHFFYFLLFHDLFWYSGNDYLIIPT